MIACVGAMALAAGSFGQTVFGGGTTTTSTGGGGGTFGELKIGDPAPGLDVSYWYPDEPQKIEQGVVYIIDFFSVADDKCMFSIPFLSRMQELHRHRGLKVISISKDEDEAVQAFRQSNINFPLHAMGVDNKQKTTKAWMNAANVKTIPMSFVVDRTGKVVYFGDPLGEHFYDIVAATIYDRYDFALLSRVFPFIREGRRAASIMNFNEAYRIFDMAIKEEPRIMAPYAVEKLEIMLTKEKNYERGYEYARQLFNNYQNDPLILSQLAELIATDPSVENRDFELATQLAQKAVDFTRSQDPDYLSSLATVLTAKGDYAKAAEYERNAWRFSVPLQKAYHKQRLEEIQTAIDGGAKPALTTRAEIKDEQTKPISR